MSIKRLGDFTGSVILIVLSMIVFAGASGLSYTAHYCNGNLSGIAFYTELGLQKPVTCGCGHPSDDKQYPSSGGQPVMQKTACCSNIKYFSKLNLESPVTFSASEILLQSPLLESEAINKVKFVSETDNVPVFDFRFRPPPIAGRELVLFLSQQRIPYSIYS
ncbi:MAG: hypothetical protein IPN08_13085 [Bacteroidales bacterium]|nr:hypothetical protein [Bacteroidales bacterium]